MPRERILQVTAKQVDLLGNVRISATLGVVDRKAWDVVANRPAIVKQLLSMYVQAMCAPDGADISNAVEKWEGV